MSWFLIALIGPILWAIVNHIDKFLLSDRFEGSNVGALMIFSTLQCGLLLPILYFINNDIFNLSVENIILLIVVGILSVFAIMPYMYALDEEEASIVIPLFQLIPIWGYMFSYFILGETLTWMQLVGCLLIIGGSAIITLEFDEEKKIKFKKRIILLMLLSTILFALYETLFKFVAVDVGFVVSSFWEYLGVFSMGILFYLFIKKYKLSFLNLLKTKGGKIISLNIANESLTIIGNFAVNFALLLAPVALTLTISGVQPIFVFIIGIFLTIFFPKICKEKISKKHLIQKTISILIIILGGCLVSL
ncbi:MAG: DMT family transporter [Candidatus Paceibacterota bacterium]|jgi:drug/metabolite transporter (DMT)-like permease